METEVDAENAPESILAQGPKHLKTQVEMHGHVLANNQHYGLARAANRILETARKRRRKILDCLTGGSWRDHRLCLVHVGDGIAQSGCRGQADAGVSGVARRPTPTTPTASAGCVERAAFDTPSGDEAC